MIIYTICLIVGLVFTLLSAVAGHLFGGHGDAPVGTDGQADGGLGHDGVPGITFLSPTGLASFVTAFGAFGLIFTRISVTSSVWISAPLSVMGGLVVALVILWGFNSMFKKTESSSESRVATLVGQTAAVMTPIPEDGVGEISYTQGGSRYTAAARAETGGFIGGGQTVKITRVVGNQFFVQKNS